jgi:alpha/beta superfamily hydrolase
MDELSTSLQPITIAGPVGALAGRLEIPDARSYPQPRYLAVFGHPHPLQGGTMQNLVVVYGARALASLGGEVARFDFRGVGKSVGRDAGPEGSLDDYLAAVAAMRRRWPRVAPLMAAGFSYGSLRAIECAARGRAELCLAVAPPLSLPELLVAGTGRVECPAALVLAGKDDLVPRPSAELLAERFADLRTVEVVEDADHLFKGRIPALAAAVERAAVKLLADAPGSAASPS